MTEAGLLNLTNCRKQQKATQLQLSNLNQFRFPWATPCSISLHLSFKSTDSLERGNYSVIHLYLSQKGYQANFDKGDKCTLRKRVQGFACQDGELYYVGGVSSKCAYMSSGSTTCIRTSILKHWLLFNSLGPKFSSQGHFHSLQLLNVPQFLFSRLVRLKTAPRGNFSHA